METFMTEKRKKGYLRTGIVKVLPVKRGSDWLPENSDSSFMNTGAKVEYVTPRNQRTGLLIDPLYDLTEEQKAVVAKQLGLKDVNDLNIHKMPEKFNYWINKMVLLDKNGKFLNLSEVADFISFKILEANTDYIAPSWDERYNKGTYKFALVFEEEEARLKNIRIDTKKEAYMMFGKMDGSVRKLSDFLWIYYLTNKNGKRLPINPSLDYLRGEVGRIVDESTGDFLAIVTDPDFETKALVQRAVNIGLISRNGQMFTIFGESKATTLEELIAFLKDDRNNNTRLSLIGKIEADERGALNEVRKDITQETRNTVKENKEFEEMKAKFAQLEEMAKGAIEVNNQLKEKVIALEKENENLKKQAGSNKKADNLKKAREAKNAKKNAEKQDTENHDEVK